MMEYSEDEFLMLSGIQHFAFCRRQWALIHIEQQWAENYRTIDGQIFMRMHIMVHSLKQEMEYSFVEDSLYFQGLWVLVVIVIL